MNQALFYYLNNIAGKSVCFDSLIIFIAQYLGYWLVAGFVVIVLLTKKENRERVKIFAFAAISVFLSRVVITEIIRFFYYVSRPFVNNNVYQLIFHETSGSFPSGNATFFFALAMAIFLFSQGPPSGASRGRSFSVLFFISAILMGIARIIAGVHWPIDILTGAVIGILSSLIICKIGQIFYNKN